MTSFYPAVGARATSQSTITRLLFQIHHDQNAIQDLQTQLSTGLRISKPSEDPGAAIRALAAQRGLEYKKQVDNNLQSADTTLSTTESTLAQAQTLLNEMKGISIIAAGSTLSQEESDALAIQVDAALKRLTELGNSRLRDQYLFAGSKVAQPPLESVGDAIRFNGDALDLKTITDFSSTLAANVTAQDAFGVISERIVSSVELDPSIAGDTPLANLNRGEGVRTGSISFSNGIEKVEVDLSTAHNLDDVLARIEEVSLDGRSLSVSLTPTGINIEYADALSGILRVDDVGAGNMAIDLGVKNVGTAGLSPVIGTDLDPVATLTTKVTQLLGGAGIPDPSSLVISQGGKNFVITTSNLKTVEDLLNRIQSSGARVNATLDPSGRFLAIQNIESGSTLSIGENGGTLATALGLRTMRLDTPLSELNLGQGISLNDLGDDLQLTRTDGTTFGVNLNGAKTVGDVIDQINNNVDNFTPGLRITAALAASGNGITLSADVGAQAIAVGNAGGSQAALGLGLVAKGENAAVGTDVGTNNVIGGSDVSGIEVDGAFNSLIRLRQAIEDGNIDDMQRIAAALENDVQRMSIARGFIGSRQQSIDSMKDLSADQQVQLTQIESDELDADLASVISELAAREAALQASLQLMSQATRLTLFDFI